MNFTTARWVFFRDVMKSLRPNQWYKNLLLFIGITFAGELGNLSLYPKVILAFLAFCGISGAVYIVNDVIDKEADLNHPKKKNRPIASGRIGSDHAILFAIVLAFVSTTVALWIELYFGLIVIGFFLLNQLYSYLFKKYIIVDVLLISIFFVLRAVSGAMVANSDISPWMVICAFLLALFLALAKRRHELDMMQQKAMDHRVCLENYSPELLDQFISIVTASLIMAYCLYTFNSGFDGMMITIPLVIFGLFRYLYLIHSHQFGDEPELIFKDRPMVADLILWVLLSLVIYYGILL